MFEIIVTRNYDGRYLASIPALGPNVCTINHSMQGAIRAAQAESLRVIADHMTANRAMPDAMAGWFFVAAPDGSRLNIGGSRHNQHPDAALMLPANNVVPPIPSTIKASLKKLPKPGSTEYEAFSRALLTHRVSDAAALPPSTTAGA